MNKLRVGVIGCGRIACEKHLPGLAALDNVEVSAFCSGRKESALRAAARFGLHDARIYTDADQLIDNKEIDIIHICTPGRTHAALSIRALEAGKHVMCEKPMATTAADARLMVEAANRTGKKLTIGCQNRFRIDAEYLKEICARGDLGEIYYARALALRRRGVPHWLLTGEAKQGEGPLWDIGTHALDMTLWLMDNFEPASVTGKLFHKLNNRRNEANVFGAWNPDSFTTEDSAFGFITMKNGALVSLETSWALNMSEDGEARAVLCGTDGGADMQDGLRINGTEFGVCYTKNPEFGWKRNIGMDTFYSHPERGYADAGAKEMKSWIDCIIQDTEPVVKPEQSLVVAELLEAVSTSSQSGRPVVFDQTGLSISQTGMQKIME